MQESIAAAPEQNKPKQNIRTSRVSRKTMTRVRFWLRTGIQVLFFLLLPSAYSGAFAGVKYLAAQIGSGAALALTPLVTVLIVLLAYTVLFGRFFCGYACAFGALGDWIYEIVHFVPTLFKGKKKAKAAGTSGAVKSSGAAGKTKKTGAAKKNASVGPVMQALSGVKYIVLAVILVLAFTGKLSELPRWSPWDVFSMLRAGNTEALRTAPIGCAAFAGILAGMAFVERFFCRFLCPMGAVFSLMPVLPYFTLHRNRPECIRGCGRCEQACPTGVKLPADGSFDLSGECISCEKCVGVCPKSNIHCGIRKIHGNEIWFTAARAAALAAILYMARVG